ncbi:MAG: ice-binding family protein [Planctomycetota bacterium]|nr:ice-binding family protein [Planctomycetota bacterium]
MDPLTITTATFTLTDPGANYVSSTVVLLDNVATFTPDNALEWDTLYTATITTGAKDLAGNALANDFRSVKLRIRAEPMGPAPVFLGTAGSFVLLCKSGISTTGMTAITGNLGISPATKTGFTGFDFVMDSTNVFATSAIVTGKLYAADMAVPTPTNLTTAISDLETAFSDAAGRTLPTATELGAGDISGMTLTPGLYKWSSGLYVSGAGITLSGWCQ